MYCPSIMNDTINKTRFKLNHCVKFNHLSKKEPTRAKTDSRHMMTMLLVSDRYFKKVMSFTVYHESLLIQCYNLNPY